MIINIASVICAYLIGSIASAILVCKLMGLGDPRSSGSGNPGATNVLRLYGRKPAILTLAGDLCKGVIAVWLARSMGAVDWAIAAAGLAAFCGHIFPVFFNFRGGKGVATFIGVLIASNWITALLFMLTWGVIAGVFRYSSLAGISAAVLTPFYTYLLSDDAYAISFAMMALVLLWRHSKNIRNLLNGTEPKIGQKKV